MRSDDIQRGDRIATEWNEADGHCWHSAIYGKIYKMPSILQLGFCGISILYHIFVQHHINYVGYIPGAISTMECFHLASK